MTPDDHAERYAEWDLLKMDGFDNCCIGVMWTPLAEQPVLAYDRYLVIKQLMADGMDYDDAHEYHEYNQAGAFLGPGTPCFIDTGGEWDDD